MNTVRSEDLRALADADLMTSGPDGLMDLKKITVDFSLPPEQRVHGFFSQVGNPYLFKVGGLTVKIRFGHGKMLEDSLAWVLNNT